MSRFPALNGPFPPNALIGVFRERGRRNGVSSDFFPFFSVFFRFLPFFSFLPFSSVFFVFFVWLSEEGGRHPFARPFLRNPDLIRCSIPCPLFFAGIVPKTPHIVGAGLKGAVRASTEKERKSQKLLAFLIVPSLFCTVEGQEGGRLWFLCWF